jgi:hypothetical protein
MATVVAMVARGLNATAHLPSAARKVMRQIQKVALLAGLPWKTSST